LCGCALRARGGGGGFLRLILLLALLAGTTPGASGAVAAAGDPAARVLAADGVRVVYWPGHRELAERTLAAARSPQRLPGIPRDTVLTAGTIFLAPSAVVFDSLTGGRVPEWGAGVAIPALRWIVLPTYPAPGPAVRDPAVTLRHELAHLALHAYLPGPIPRWFDEGYATFTSGGWDQAAAWQIRLAFLLGRAPPLDSLTLNWPRGAEQARLAYLLSASAVQYLLEIGGESGFTALLDTWRHEGSFNAALRRVYGMTPGQFEQAWARVVRRRYGWLLALSQVTVFWVVVSLLLIVLYGIRRRRKRERLAELELHDRLYPPAEPYDADEDALAGAPEPVEAGTERRDERQPPEGDPTRRQE
jgi:hypothetical protein